MKSYSLFLVFLATLLSTLSLSLADTNQSHLPQTIISKTNRYLVNWATMPTAIPVNQYFVLEFEVREPSKTINYPIEVSVDAGMEAHNHGMNSRPVVKALGNNRFRAEGMLFHMVGKWQIYIEISRGIMKETIRIDVEI